jgi:hypothetical protein
MENTPTLGGYTMEIRIEIHPNDPIGYRQGLTVTNVQYITVPDFESSVDIIRRFNELTLRIAAERKPPA